MLGNDYNDIYREYVKNELCSNDFCIDLDNMYKFLSNQNSRDAYKKLAEAINSTLSDKVFFDKPFQDFMFQVGCRYFEKELPHQENLIFRTDNVFAVILMKLYLLRLLQSDAGDNFAFHLQEYFQSRPPIDYIDFYQNSLKNASKKWLPLLAVISFGATKLVNNGEDENEQQKFDERSSQNEDGDKKLDRSIGFFGFLIQSVTVNAISVNAIISRPAYYHLITKWIEWHWKTSPHLRNLFKEAVIAFRNSTDLRAGKPNHLLNCDNEATVRLERNKNPDISDIVRLLQQSLPNFEVGELASGISQPFLPVNKLVIEGDSWNITHLGHPTVLRMLKNSCKGLQRLTLHCPNLFTRPINSMNSEDTKNTEEAKALKYFMDWIISLNHLNYLDISKSTVVNDFFAGLTRKRQNGSTLIAALKGMDCSYIRSADPLLKMDCLFETLYKQDSAGLLEYLNLSGIGLEDYHLQNFCVWLCFKAKNLKVLDISRNKFALAWFSLATALKGAGALEEFNFSENRLSGEGLKHFMSVLAGHPTLKRMHFNQVLTEGDLSTHSVVQTLIQDHSLTALSLGFNQLMFMAINPRENLAFNLYNLFKEKNTRLSYLDFSGSGLKAEDCRLMAEGLNSNQSLETLILDGNNKIGYDGAAYLLGALVYHPNIKLLSLNNVFPQNENPNGSLFENPAYQAMLDALFNFFSHNQSICEVRLSGNAFTLGAVANIINRMGTAPSLKLLDLRKTICNDVGRPFVFDPTVLDAQAYLEQSFKNLHLQIEIAVGVPQELCADESGRIKKRNADLSEAQNNPYSMLIDSHYGFQRKAYEQGLIIQTVSRDGDGFFHAVADQLVRQGIEDSLLAPEFYPGYPLHMRLRLGAVNYIKQNRERFVRDWFRQDRNELSRYIAKMQESGTWPDEIIKYALVDKLKISLHFYEERHKPDLRLSGIEEDFYIHKINPRHLKEDGLPQIRLGCIKSIGYYSSILISEDVVAAQPQPSQIVASSVPSVLSKEKEKEKEEVQEIDKPFIQIDTVLRSNKVSERLKADSPLPASENRESCSISERSSLSEANSSRRLNDIEKAIQSSLNEITSIEGANRTVIEAVNQKNLIRGIEASKQNLISSSAGSSFRKSLSFFQERERTPAAESSGRSVRAKPQPK